MGKFKNQGRLTGDQVERGKKPDPDANEGGSGSDSERNKGLPVFTITITGRSKK